MKSRKSGLRFTIVVDFKSDSHGGNNFKQSKFN